MFVQQGDDGLNVVLLDDVQNLRTFNQNTIEHLQNTWRHNNLIRTQYRTSRIPGDITTSIGHLETAQLHQNT